MLIFQSKNFIVESHNSPEIGRLEGGHIKISPIISVEDRSKLSSKQAIELMRLTIVTGEAMKLAMSEIGVDIGRINYQDNGNWKPEFHIHLYGRARKATMQPFGSPIVPGHKPEYKPLNQEDIERIKYHIEKLFKEEKYSNSNWKLNQ